MIRHPQGRRTAHRARLEPGQNLGHVANLGGEGRRTPGPLFVVSKEMSVLLEGGTAAGRVDRDDVHPGSLEDFDQGASELSGTGWVACVERERATATLRAGRDDVAAFS